MRKRAWSLAAKEPKLTECISTLESLHHLASDDSCSLWRVETHSDSRTVSQHNILLSFINRVVVERAGKCFSNYRAAIVCKKIANIILRTFLGSNSLQNIGFQLTNSSFAQDVSGCGH